MSLARLTRPLMESVAKTVRPYGDIIELDFQRNNLDLLENLKPLTGTELQVLNLSYNRLQSLQNLVPIHTLRELYAASNSLLNVNVALPFPRLQVLDLSENKIFQITAELPDSIIELNLRGNLICTFENIDPIFRLTNLRNLDLRQNPILEKYVSPEAFYGYVLKLLPQLEVINGLSARTLLTESGTLIPHHVSTPSSESHLSQPEDDLVLTGIDHAQSTQPMLLKTRSTRPTSAPLYDLTESRLSSIVLRDSVPTDGLASRTRSSATSGDEQRHVNVKIYSNYYERTDASPTRRKSIADSQRLVNEHIILFRSPTRSRPSSARVKQQTSTSIGSRPLSAGTPLREKNSQVGYLSQAKTTSSFASSSLVLDEKMRPAPQTDFADSEMCNVEVAVDGKAIAQLQIPLTKDESNELKSHHDELERLKAELDAALQLVKKEEALNLGKDGQQSTIRDYKPTIKSSKELRSLMAETDMTETDILRAEVRALEEAVGALELQSVVTYPHPEIKQEQLHAALYNYRRKLFQTILDHDRVLAAEKRARQSDLEQSAFLRKQVQEGRQREEMLQRTIDELRDELKTAKNVVSNDEVAWLKTQVSSYSQAFETMSKLIGPNGTFQSFIDGTFLEDFEQHLLSHLEGLNERLGRLAAWFSSHWDIRRRFQGRLEAMAESLEDCNQRLSLLQTDYNALKSRHATLRETHKALQLEKLRIEQEVEERADAIQRPPCANFAVQVWPASEATPIRTNEPSHRRGSLGRARSMSSGTALRITNDGFMTYETDNSPAIHISGVNDSNITFRARGGSTRVPAIKVLGYEPDADSSMTSIPITSARPSDAGGDVSVSVATPANVALTYDVSMCEDGIPIVSLRPHGPSSVIGEGRRSLGEAEPGAGELRLESLKPRAISSGSSRYGDENRERAERIMGMLNKLDALMKE
ncbi:Leucine-rich repeat protein [Giardia muris]|uniref:Leucine-rich repeat protein n=1 Tax=Giardia muris TaxID=5742 RepID=A0A4Z1SUM9_GIAMU|nr:Leucine-rich repeat protein [Giardia muris]|eukprot:TNJ28665.1 Leucine-rich repeat protein [Giardia muris]